MPTEVRGHRRLPEAGLPSASWSDSNGTGIPRASDPPNLERAAAAEPAAFERQLDPPSACGYPPIAFDDALRHVPHAHVPRRHSSRKA